MIIKPDWNVFKVKFGENPQKNFEWFCYLLFCIEFNKNQGIYRYKNQSAIETNPITKGVEVIGWQAKFYESTLSNYKDDLIETVQKAKRNYKDITKIFFYTNQEWGQGKNQNDPIAKVDVEEIAKQLNIKIEWRMKSYFESPFVVRDNAEIAYNFFSLDSFDKKENNKYNKKWFEQKLNESIKNIDNRYSKDLNVELKISTIMDSIEKSKSFIDNLNKKYIEMNQEFFKIEQNKNDIEKTFFNDVIKNINAIKVIFNKSDNDINLLELRKECAVLKDRVNSHAINNSNCSYKEFKKEFDKFNTFVTQDHFDLVEDPFVMLIGNAGVGKSHFITNQALRRQKEGKLSILLLGQLFRSKETPLEQIRCQLNIAQNEDMDDFFYMLNDYGKLSNERVILFIDALNEGSGDEFWKSTISGFVEYIKQFKWIGLVMSVRDTYESEIIPDNFFENNKVLRVPFNGFDDLDKAIEKFFDFYNVQLGINDSLRYKFTNPLFLKIYCITYSKEEKDKSYSLQDLFNNYFKKVNSDLKNRITNYPKNSNLVNKALEVFIDIKSESKKIYILYDEVLDKINLMINPYNLSVNLLEELIDENILTVNHVEDESVVYLTYEIFEDFLIAKKIIDSNKVIMFKNKNQLKDFFSINNKYYNWLTDKYSNQGIFDSLVIQLPDLDFKIQTDEFELYYWPSHILNYKNIDFEYSFYNSMMWRNPKKIKKVAHSYILNKSLCMAYSEPYVFNLFFDKILVFTTVKNHLYNANFLYNLLIDLKLSEFEKFWTTYLNKNFHEDKTFKTLIRWAWKSNLNGIRKNEEMALLLGMNLSWFLASTNIKVRDVSIKAMVKLFTNNLKVFIELLKKFRYVKDLYILEGLLCIAYGSILNTDDITQIEKLSKYVYKEFFDSEFFIEHALIRDYLSGIVEYSISKGFFKNINIKDIRPPYNNSYSYYEVSQQEIDMFRKDEFSKDINKLDPNMSYYEELDFHYKCQNIIIDSLEINCTDVDKPKGGYIQNFESTEKIDYILPEYRNNFIRMVIKEIFDMGYNYIKFGEFDLEHILVEKYNDKSISIGQKYEWIAFNKILTIYLDNIKYICSFKEENRLIEFQGMWQLWAARRIDPSIDYWNPIERQLCEEEENNMIVESIDSVFENPRLYFEHRKDDDNWISIGQSQYIIENQKENLKLEVSDRFVKSSKMAYATPFLINNDELTKFIESIYNKTMDYRNLAIEDLYAKEIYWSQAYTVLTNVIDNNDNNKFSDRKFSCQCIWDINDGAMNNYIEFSILTSYIIKELKLSIGANVFELFQDNELACYSLYDVNRQDILLFKKSKISKYLTNKFKTIVWTIYDYSYTSNQGQNVRSQRNIKGVVCFDGERFYELRTSQ